MQTETNKNPTLYMAYGILRKCAELNLINRDDKNKNNIIVYREGDEHFKEGWYSQNIWGVAQELMGDAEGLLYLLTQIRSIEPDFTPDRMPF